MAWTNIFDLAEWDVYIRFLGATAASPDSVNHLVRAEDLDPAVGTVTVQDGVIICDLEALGSGSGTMIQVVVMPSGAEPSGQFRVTGLDDDFPLQVPGAGGSLQSIGSLASAGASTYDAIAGAVDDALEPFLEVTDVESSGVCPSGEGLSFAGYVGIG